MIPKLIDDLEFGSICGEWRLASWRVTGALGSILYIIVVRTAVSILSLLRLTWQPLVVSSTILALLNCFSTSYHFAGSTYNETFLKYLIKYKDLNKDGR